MPRHYESSAACCPYYNGEETLKLFCDGFEPGMTLHVKFQSERGARRHKARYCRSMNDWQACPLAQTIEQEENRRRE